MPAGRVYDARLEIVSILESLNLALDNGVAFTIHDYPPGQLTGPAVYVDMPRLATQPRTVYAQYPVIFIFDGDDRLQTQAMDTAQAVAWDAFTDLDGMAVEAVDPETIDPGSGTRTRALALLVTVDLAATVLCPDMGALTTPERTP